MPQGSATFDVEVTSTVDLTSMIRRRLVDSERKVFANYRNEMLAHIKSRWVGWHYEGRPARAPRNVSLAKWESRIETTESAATLVIFNQARSWSGQKPYVAYVRRAKGLPEEWRVQVAAIMNSIWPRMRQALLDEVIKNVFQPAEPKKLRGRGGGPTQRMTLHG